MKYKTHKEMSELSEKVIETARNGMTPAWEKLTDELHSVKVRLILPNGELFNERIAGHIWAWKLQGKIHTIPVPPNARLQAHGLEGCFEVRTDLMIAIVVWDEVPKFRCAVAID